jgi:putative oxidoreductase
MAGASAVKRNLAFPAWIGWLLRLALATIFIYAGVTKVLAPVRFAADIRNFHLLPQTATLPLAFYLPWLEVLCGVALLVPWFYRGSMLVLLVLAFVFVIALMTARIRGIDVSCGCFGHATDFSFASHLALDCAIIAALFLLLRGAVSREKVAAQRSV